MKKISTFFNNTFKNHSKDIIQTFAMIFGIVLVILLSGYGYTTFSMSTKGKIILYGITFIYFGFLFFLRVRFSFIVDTFKKKKVPMPSPLGISFLLFIFFSIVSFIGNTNKADNINTYISFILTMTLSFFILSTFEVKRILKIFKNTIFIICSIGIVIFLISYVAKIAFPSFYFYSSKAAYGSHFFISNDMLSGLTTTYHFKPRLTGVFWEPSVLGVMIVIALVAEIYTKRDKLTLIRIIIFVLAAILTKSTTVYVLLPVVFFLFVVENSKNIYFKAFVIFAFLVCIFLVVAFEKDIIKFLMQILPDIFKKMDPNKVTSSFATRLHSFEKCFEVFLKNPFFGFGGVTSREKYFAVSSSIIDAQTSTFGVALSSFGLAGIVYMVSVFGGIIFCKKIDSFSKFILVPLVFFISSVQSQTEMLAVNIVYLIPLAIVALPKKAVERNHRVFAESYSSTATIKDLILKKDDSGEISRNVLGALLLRGFAILIAFFTIPVYLRYFDYNDSTYGIWIAITSILSVITIFDFGMGNGLKNKLIKNISDNNNELSKTYVSTTYVLTAIIGVIVIAIFSSVILLMNDSILLKTFFNGQESSEVDLKMLRIGVIIIIFAIGTQFFMKNINYVLQAHQRNAITGSFMVITNSCLMLFALVFANVFPLKSRILALSLAYLIFLILPLVVASIILYKGKYRHLAPSIHFIDFKKSKTVVNSSLKFFVVQIGNLFLWSINEFIILFSFQSSLVTEYTEYYKLFSLMPIILGTVIQQPFWTAISKAEAESNLEKINKYCKFLLFATIACVLFNFLVMLSLPLVFDIWLGEHAPAITTSKLLAFTAYSLIYPISLFFVIIMNALTLFKTQITTALSAVLIKIPAVILITNVFNWDVGWEIVIYINMISYLPIVTFAFFEIAKKYKALRSEKYVEEQ